MIDDQNNEFKKIYVSFLNLSRFNSISTGSDMVNFTATPISKVLVVARAFYFVTLRSNKNVGILRCDVDLTSLGEAPIMLPYILFQEGP